MIGDDELNFTDAEARAMGHDRVAAIVHVPVAPMPNIPPRQHPIHPEDGRFILFGVVAGLVMVAVVAIFGSSGSHSNSSPQNIQSAIQQQSSPNNQQSSQPEYFPAGWDYIKAANPTEMYKGDQLYTIPKDCTFFVSLRYVNGSHLAVAEDGSWNGWVKIIGHERQIPMHPDFKGAKTFIEKIDWNLVESSNSLEAPSQEAAQTDSEALRASEAQPERIDMSLFQKKDQQEPAEITIQGEEAIIPQPPESEQPEKKVKLPKTKWYAEGGASAPLFSSWRWVCASRDGLRCALQDVNGKYVQSFFWNGGSVQASAISTEALFPRALVWGCAKMPGILYCSILDGRGTNRQGCSYDGKSLACGN